MEEYQEFEEDIHEGDLEENQSGQEELLAARKITASDIKEHMTGPVISLILHVIAVAFFSSIIVFQPPEERKDIEVEMKQVDIKEPEDIPKPPEPEPEDMPEIDIEIERPDVVTDTPVEVEQVQIDAPSTEIVMPQILNMKPSASALVIPGVMAARSGRARKSALKKYGGDNRTEKSVLAGLYWLRDHQNPDGSWGDTGKANFPALTGFALMAFLAHGETPQSPEFGECVLKAIQKLVEYIGDGSQPAPGGKGYGHGIVAYAISEAYAMTQIPMLEDAVNKAMGIVIRGQNPLGGFDYNYNTGAPKALGGNNDDDKDDKKDMGTVPRCDLSLGGFHYQALKAAFAGGATVSGLEEAIDKGIKCMKETNFNRPKNIFFYSNSGIGASNTKRPETMTPVGVLCLQLFGEGKSPEAQSGLQWILQNNFTFDWDGSTGHERNWFLYKGYYQTQAIFQGENGSGPKWKQWNNLFKTTLIRKQFKDGHWEPPSMGGGQGWAEGTKLKGIDPLVYSTALCCLMLEVYYRYLPTFKVSSHKGASTDGPAAADDDSGEGLVK